MPRVNRRRQPLGSRAIIPGSARWQTLMHGLVLFDDDAVFESEAAERMAWRQNRSQLMADAEPGRRPIAYYKHELLMTPVPCWWHQELEALLDRDLIPRDEIPAIEKQHPELGEEGGVKYASFENPEWVHQQRYSKAVLGHLAAELDLASRWHCWRGREELSKAFAKRAAIIRQVAGETAA